MISPEEIQLLATKNQSQPFPNIVREYLQHLFLARLYWLEQSEKILFKGGTALRIVYDSPRFSEDLDFTLVGVLPHEQKSFIESKFIDVLDHIKNTGIQTELGPKPDVTKEEYYGEATFSLYDYQPVVVSINVSSRNGRITGGEIESIVNDFVPVYNLYRLKQSDLVDEKIDALLDRRKARDFYDIYYLMKKNLLNVEQKQRLGALPMLLKETTINFQEELSVLLPQNQQAIIRDFRTTLLNELQRQLS